MKELARFTTLEEMALALLERRKSLGLSQLLVDEISGLQNGYTGKIEAEAKNPGRGKALGKTSIPLLLGALGCELALMPSAAKHLKKQGVTTRYAHNPKSHHAQLGAKGGRARAASMSKKKLRAIARAGARARWKAERERKL